jgi:hypothetical protein
VIEVDRRQASRFRAAVRRCVAGRPRGLAPLIALQQDTDALTLSAVLEETALALRLPTAQRPNERLVVPFATLAALDGPGGGTATLQANADGTLTCRWQERGQERVHAGTLVPAEQQPTDPAPADTWQRVDAGLLAALHACGQTASRAPAGRLAMNRVQLRGPRGEVAATDGRQLLLWGGLALPFAEDLLVPAVPIFGSRDLACEPEVRVGRTASHVLVAAGAWTVWLAVDATARYPDVTAVLPRSSRRATLVLDEADATALLRDLVLPAPSRDEVVPVLLDLGAQPALRWPEGTEGRRGPLSLIRSRATGPTTTARLDARLLARALTLGFRELHATSADAPVLFRDDRRCYLLATCGSASAPVAADPVPLPVAPPADHASQLPEETMNGESKDGPPAEAGVERVLDPLAEAEAIRLAMGELGRRLGRLIASLRQFHKQRRALQAAWSSLQHLRLGPPEEP